MAKKSGEEQASDKLALKETVQKKIDNVLKKPRLNPVDAYNLIKGFFQAYAENDYQYTREELIHELDKCYLDEERKERMQEIILRLGEMEFGQPEYSRDELESLITDFREIVDHMIHAETLDLGFFDKVAKKLKYHVTKKEKGEESQFEQYLGEISQEIEEGGRESIQEESFPSQQPESRLQQAPAPETVPEPEDSVPEPQSSIQSDIPAPEPQDNMHPELGELKAEFDQLLKEFYGNINRENYVLAKLDYEEMKHAYDKMGTDQQHDHYDSLKEAFDKLTEVSS